MARQGAVAAAWRRFGAWRRGRPFWGGLLLIASGVWIVIVPVAQGLLMPMNLVVHAGIAGISGYFIGILLPVAGVLAWFQPRQVTFVGVTAMLLSVGSFLLTNLGGFIVGMLLGIFGSALVLAWSPTARTPRSGRPRPGTHHVDDDETQDEAGTAQDTRGDAAQSDPSSTQGSSDPAQESPRPSPPPGQGPSSLGAVLAVPLALVLMLPTAPVLADADDDGGSIWDRLCPWCSSDDDDEAEEDGRGEDEEAPGRDGEDGDDEGDGSSEEEKDEEAGGEDEPEADPEACKLTAGAQAEEPEELIEAVADCRAAEEAGMLPEVPVGDEGCFTGSTRESGLTAERLTMSGARFDGVVQCPTAEGMDRYLRLSMSKADFSGAELRFAAAGATTALDLPSMVMDGDVVMHVTRMRVRILGIPLTFTPSFPPPLLLPWMIVTDVEVDQPLAASDLMTIGSLNVDPQAA